MNSGKNTGANSRNGGESTLVTPSIALLNQKLGTCPAPRMLTQYELGLLRQCVKEAVEGTRKVLANNESASRK